MTLKQCPENCDHKMNSLTALCYGSVKVWAERIEGQKKLRGGAPPKSTCWF